MQKSKVKSAGKKSKLLFFSLLLILLFFTSYFLLKNHRIGADEPGSATANPALSPTVTPDLADLNWPTGQMIDVPILMYHHIGALPADADDIRKGLTVSAEEFEAQMKYLKDNSYKGLSFVEMYRMVAKDSPLQSKNVVLTFDDGYLDNYEVARPILEKYGFSATFFIISGDVGKDGYMDQVQIKKLSDASNEIGSHSVTHPDLATLDYRKIENELSQSKNDLETMIQGKIISFCYPAGKYNQQVLNMMDKNGYKIAVTTKKWQPFSTDKPFEVPRYRINPGANLQNLLK